MIKQAIVDVLGERELVLPDLIAAALAANGRTKYFFTLLQLASAHADAPDTPVPDLRVEREVAGIQDERFDQVIGDSRSMGDRYRIPRLDAIVARLISDMGAMILPLAAHAGESDAQIASFEDRLSSIVARVPRTGTAITAEAVAAFTSSDPERGDSGHRLVLELHKAIDQLVASLATEDVDGAKTYRLAASDHVLVAAFMAGVHRTEAARIGHPGLGTTATRSGSRLVIENDIGATSAHVVVIHINQLVATITATDVHLRRLEFLQQLMAEFSMQWTDPRSRRAPELEDTGVFYECVGTFVARDENELEHFLNHLGSRLVFLIDWNRARKALGRFVPKRVAIALLAEAAAEGHGHRGLLEMGGEQLVFDAMATVIRTPLRYGERLDDVLGVEDAAAFLGLSLRTCGTGLRAGQSRPLLAAHVRADLANVVHAKGERLLGPIAEHAAIITELARGLHAQLADLANVCEPDGASAAKRLEHRADEIVSFVRSVVARRPDAGPYLRVIERADDAADALEEAAFFSSFIAEAQRPLLAPLPIKELGELALRAGELYATAVASARNGIRAIHTTLEAVDAIIVLERRMDDAERVATLALARDQAIDAKLFAITTRICVECERAVDALTHATLVLSDHLATA